MIESEWKVVCAKGHRFYERVHGIPRDDVQFTDCPTCAAPRRGVYLPPVTEGDADDPR